MKQYESSPNSEFPYLSREHLAMLRKDSGISDAVIAARGYRTITESSELQKLSFARSQCLVPTLLLPVHTTDGGNSLYTHRPDLPRVTGAGANAANWDYNYI